MNTVQRLALGTATLAALAGGAATASSTSAEAAVGSTPGQTAQLKQQGATRLVTETECSREIVSFVVPSPVLNDGTKPPKCRCGKKCPITPPPANCKEGEKRCKKIVTCNFSVACDGVVKACSVKVTVETCVAKGTNCP